MGFKQSIHGFTRGALTSIAIAALFTGNAQAASDKSGQSASTEAALAQANSADERYTLSRGESILLINLDVQGELMAKADYLHFENVFTGQTYRVKMRSGTHLLKVDAGVYRADINRLNQRVYGLTNTGGAGIELPAGADLTLLPQTVNFAGSWAFSSDEENSDLSISDARNPAFAIAQKYPQISQYPLRANIGESTRLVAFDWPLDSREIVSFREQ